MNENKNFFRASAEDFKKIPGSPVAYWVGDKSLKVMAESDPLGMHVESRCGMNTSNNDYYLKLWFEIGRHKIGLDYEDTDSFLKSGLEYVPYNKGGSFRKWYGNLEYVLWYGGKHYDELLNLGNHLPSRQYYFQKCITWSDVTSSHLSFRMVRKGSVFDGCAAVAFPAEAISEALLGFLNSPYVEKLSHILNPTIHFKLNDFARLPYVAQVDTDVGKNVRRCCDIARCDWDAYETSWDFAVNPLVGLCDSLRSLRSLRQQPQAIPHSSFPIPNSLNPVNPVNPVEKLYADLREKWVRDCEEMRRLETENNRIFIEAYGLQDELTPEVPWHEITLTCNPFYRYAVKNEELGMRNEELPRVAELEERLKGDTVKELVSYAVGCMMGRYSLEKPGLILADQGSTIKDYWEKLGIRNEELGIGNEGLGIGNEGLGMTGGALGDRALPLSAAIPHSSFLIPHSFEPDEDGIIPVLDNDWFADDIVTRFKAFIKAAFGEEHFFENMAWIEEALGKDIRSYFTKDFYKDHLQRYQNRPIYWLFQSPKGAFRALVYMHRYKPDMVGGVLGYLRSLQTKVDNQLDVAMQVGADESKSASERVRANKDAVKYAKAKKELDEYEKNVLYPLSTERIEIDLDDGVKVNYKKFGSGLAKVKALE